jgi:hypothetical protein
MPSDADRHDVHLIFNGNYGRQLSRQFSPQELRAGLKVMRLSLPSLNQAQFRTENLERLDQTARRLGARLVAKDFPGREGLGLLGFYVEGGWRFKQPIICVNCAHHPVAVAAAFWHEIGHHLTSRMVSGQHEPLNLSLKAEYYRHLAEPFELIADMLVCLAAYPKRAARRLFGRISATGGVGDGRIWDEFLHKAKQHLQIEIGFEFEQEAPVAQNLHYLAGMLHFTKLRMALLSEYDI